MSWMKREQAGAGPGAQPYAAPQAQPFGNQQNMYPNYQQSIGGSGTAAQLTQQQPFFQMPPQQASQPTPQQQYNNSQQYSQPYPQDYPPNTNQYQQPAQTQYNQNYDNQFSNPQQNYQQSFYQNQPAQQNLPQNYSQNAANPRTGTGTGDAWEDNWDWGWEENAKKAQNAQNMAQPPQGQQPVFNNANVIEESFASSDSWNWAMDEKKDSKAPVAASPPAKQDNNEPAALPTHAVLNNVQPEPIQNNINSQQAEEVKTLSDREVIKERLPNLALGKRFNLENLTPQWSIESQMSQESSDGPHTQSEGTYRSENQSRNSGESPGPNTDNSNFNYAQPGFDETYTQNSEWSKNSDEATVADASSISRRESHEELSYSLQDMSITKEHYPTNGMNAHSIGESRSVQEVPNVQPPPAISPANFPQPISGSASVPSMTLPPPPPVSAAQLPPQASASLPRPPSSTSSLPGHLAPAQPNSPQPPPTSSPATLPPSLPPTSNSQNPFQRAGPFSHKSSSVPPQQFQPQMTSSNLTSPAAVNKVSQNRVPVGFEANLETTPDNSERPDQPQVLFRPMQVPQAIPDNMEVAPQNDRNEYLQTGHLSSSDYSENTHFTRNLPPPGLRRMVVGQQESEYQNLNISGDEPPPGLSRMVPGQQTEADNAYSQSSDNYMDRHIDGQPMDNASSGGRPFRQADGQQNPDSYPQPVTTRANDRRSLGFDRMVPGEPSNDEYSQYQGSNYASNEQRVVTGLDHDFPVHIEASPSDVREQNMDGSDYTEPPPRNVLGAREAPNEVPQEFAAPDDRQREVTMEGENLQDLSVISSADLTYSREHLDGADLNATDGGTDRNNASESLDRPANGSRKQSLIRVHSSGEDSERDRAFKSSPRRDRHKTSRDRDRDRNRDRDKEGRYSRSDRAERKYDRDDRRRDDKRTDKDRRERDRGREGDASPDTRKHRRSTRSRKYDEDDTDYYSDRERDRRRYREGSYTKPPRPEDRDRRYEERRYHTVERDRRDRPRDSTRRDRERERYERPYNDYRDIDPSRKYGNLHREREEERRRVTFSTDAKSYDSRSEGDTLSSASRPESREAGGTDEEAPRGPARRPRHHRPDPYYDGDTLSSASRPESREAGGTDEEAPRGPARRPRHHRPDPYYDGYGGGYQDPYAVLQRQQYEYYKQLRVTDPAAYMLVYKQLTAGHMPPVPRDARTAHYAGEVPGYPGYEGPERGSVHSGRSSTTCLKGNDTFYVYRHDGGSLHAAPSPRTDLSDRDLNTDASLGLQLDESTVRSERMTPFRFSTAHIKASIGSRDIVVVPPSYPVDGKPATVQLVSLAAARAADPPAAELMNSPGPLLTGVTHKKSVIEYCMVRVRNASREGARDVIGYVLVWELLALMLRQNGVVVGTDIAELLMKNTREYQLKPSARPESRRESCLSGSLEDTRASASASPPLSGTQRDSSLSPTMGEESLGSPVDEKAALDKFREYLLYGNRQEALEWAMNNNLWGHALQLSWSGERRARAGVAARFLAALPRTDPLHTLYAALAHAAPPAATCVSEEKWGEWRTHAAMLVANTSSRPDVDARTLTTLGDSLSSRGLIYSGQFCYVSAGVPFSRHPLAPLPPPPAPGCPSPGPSASPPRLALLLADPRPASLAQLASPRAILATEIYEYARSLSGDYVIPDLQVFKLMSACRLVDAGQYARALAYVEAAARAVTRTPQHYSRALVAALATLADRLKYHDPALVAEALGGGAEEGAESGEGSPRHHQWLDDVQNLAHTLQRESASQQVTPQHQHSVPAHAHSQPAWGDQAQQYQQTPNQTYAEPEETPDYSQYYQQPPPPQPDQPTPPDPAPYQPNQHADTYAGQNVDYAGQSADYAGQSAEYSGQNADYAGQSQENAPQYQYEDWSRTEETHSQSYGDPYWQGDSYSYGESGAGAGAGETESPRPAITMPGSAPAKQAYTNYDDDRPPSAEGADRESDTPKSSKDKWKEVKTDSKGRSWIGGFLTKLSLRPPNQMILPDDKNPTIVWDADRKQWRNTDGSEDEARAHAPPPPPKLADLMPQHPHPTASPPLQSAPPGGSPSAPGAPPAAGAPPVSNIFKMQKGRHIKKSYVDVFNPSGAASRPLPPAAEVLGPPGPAPALAPNNYFVPAPPNAGGIYEPVHAPEADLHTRSGI